MDFVNRNKELNILAKIGGSIKVLVIFGRRRVGKTALTKHFKPTVPLIYSQAIEATPEQQVLQIAEDTRKLLPSDLNPKSWQELLFAFSLAEDPYILVLDEFPYLVAADPSLPSRLQHWLDHKRPQGCSLIILGSSQKMMHDAFLNGSSPLYGRADQILHLQPMGYHEFCLATEKEKQSLDTFLVYAMVGGVPRYWNMIDPSHSPLEVANDLYFGELAKLSEEPERLLRDEGVHSLLAKSVLEAIGRGASKPSEVASRVGIPQSSLSKPLQLLRHCSLVDRITPFAENEKSSKRSIYEISDIPMSFWYRVYSPHRSRWGLYGDEKKMTLLRDFAGKVFEQEVRRKYPDARP